MIDFQETTISKGPLDIAFSKLAGSEFVVIDSRSRYKTMLGVFGIPRYLTLNIIN